MKRFCLLVGLTLVLALSQAALGADTIEGTWKINLAKSKYSPANLAPKSGTSVITAAPGGGIKVVADGVDSQGRKTHSEYTTKLDGKDVTITSTVDGKPNPDQDVAAWRKIDDFTYENVAKLKGKVLTTTRVVVAKDGKTRTNTITGTNAQGQAVNHTVVYEK
jgi:hypothetical protein